MSEAKKSSRDAVREHINSVMPIGEEMTLGDIYWKLEKVSYTITRPDISAVLAEEHKKGNVSYRNLYRGGYAYWKRTADIEPPKQPKSREGVKVIERPAAIYGSSTDNGRVSRITVPAAPWEMA